MTTDSRRLDLVIVGGLTIDRFPDGSVAPGGSVIHASRVLGDSVALGIVTIAGDEPIAQSGLAELRMLARRVICHAAPRTIAFRHRESRTGRRMWVEPGKARITLEHGLAETLAASAILFAPVTDEIDPAALVAWPAGPARAAILQGWLRATEDGEVQPRRLAELGEELRSVLSGMELLVASREDLRADGADPQKLLELMRSRFGPHPILVLTDREHGAWVDRGGDRWHQAVQRLVEGVPTVGAGDILAAALTIRIAAPDRDAWLHDNVEAATLDVADALEARRPER